jgi:hypothetical protein
MTSDNREPQIFGPLLHIQRFLHRNWASRIRGVVQLLLPTQNLKRE